MIDVPWIKHGLVYVPDGRDSWARSSAILPTAWVRDDSIRVYFAALDAQQFGRIGYVDLDRTNPTRVIHVRRTPVLDLGELGAFDDCGVNPSCVRRVGDRLLLFYVGWQRCQRVPYMLFTGLAESADDGQTFRRVSRVPVLDRSETEPFSRSAPCVIGQVPSLQMWYWSSVKWTQEGSSARYFNVIRHARSIDGICWTPSPEPCITPPGSDDYSVGRPWVIQQGDRYRMWYSIRSAGPMPYRLGYAESLDGLAWTRQDHQAGIQVSSEGWDSEMVCYPCVIDVDERRYLFYNGNRHGLTGFGCAEWQS